jgi:hypothetical protein
VRRETRVRIGRRVSVRRRAGAETGACAQPDPATHRASPAGVSPTADAMTAADANARHGASVSLEAGRAMATHRGSLAGVFPIADAMTAATRKDRHGPSVRRWQATGPGNPATDLALALALVLAPMTMSDNARDNAHYTIPGPSLESHGFVGVACNGGERRLYC